MKKTLIASILAFAAISASAIEVGVNTGREYRDGLVNESTYGLTVGQHFGKMSATVGYDRVLFPANAQNRWSLVGGYDFAKLGPVTFTGKLGGAYLDNATGTDGYALTVGVGANYALTKNWAVTADLRRQYGQDRVRSFDGTTATAGLKYTF